MQCVNVCATMSCKHHLVQLALSVAKTKERLAPSLETVREFKAGCGGTSSSAEGHKMNVLCPWALDQDGSWVDIQVKLHRPHMDSLRQLHRPQGISAAWQVLGVHVDYVDLRGVPCAV